ncbi:hypothetical protein G7K_5174-t1 [Saitoella complicata NRRL Y-17804]|uniref:Uncharacterized protein n=3 Tax=Saitoella complicata (strain BCRC 22490 / CBS 7301 / JCM 7358 / NBRC 10748 / NRRL Y-17804) TaxID=698492 RepID=A0A0E9NMF4_SAICN|nr:hypothetical protein G7K_5174-t1 [Saitoella complicata NRRL Y-17804]
MATRIATYDFPGTTADELPLRAGERVKVIKNDEGFGDGWWMGVNERGETGLFPVVYTVPASVASASGGSAGGSREEETLVDSRSASSASGSADRPSVERTSSEAAVGFTMTEIDSAIEELSGRSSPGVFLPHNDFEDDVRSWSPESVAEWIAAAGFEDDVAAAFLDNDISGEILLELDSGSLRDELGIRSFGKRFEILRAIERLMMRNGMEAELDVLGIGGASQESLQPPLVEMRSASRLSMLDVAEMTRPSTSGTGSTGSGSGDIVRSPTLPFRTESPVPASPAATHFTNSSPVLPHSPSLNFRESPTIPSFAARSPRFSTFTDKSPRFSTYDAPPRPQSMALSPGRKPTLSAGDSGFGGSIPNTPELGSVMPPSPTKNPTLNAVRGLHRKSVSMSQVWRKSTLIEEEEAEGHLRTMSGETLRTPDGRALAHWRQQSSLGTIKPPTLLDLAEATPRESEEDNSMPPPPPPKSPRTRSRSPAKFAGAGHARSKTIDASTNAAAANALRKAKSQNAMRPTQVRKNTLTGLDKGLIELSAAKASVSSDCCGWMKKRGKHGVWKARYFCLKGTRLAYYYSDKDTKEKGLIDIKSHRVQSAVDDILVVGGGKFCFKVVPPAPGAAKAALTFTPPKVHFLAVDNREEMKKWVGALMKATIVNDTTVPVISSCTTPLVPLKKAQEMKLGSPQLDYLPQFEGLGGSGLGIPKELIRGVSEGSVATLSSVGRREKHELARTGSEPL